MLRAICAWIVALGAVEFATAQCYSVGITDDADDGTEVNGTVWYEDGFADEGLNRMGLLAGWSCDVGLRFHVPELTPGMRVVHARLIVPGTGDGQVASGVDLSIVGVDEDSAPAFGDVPPSQLPKTTATVAWNIAANWPQPDRDYACSPVPRHSPDISAIINEISQRPGWGSGFDGRTLALVIESAGVGGTDFLTMRDYHVLEQGTCHSDDSGPRPIAVILELYPDVASTFTATELLGRPTDHSVTVNALSLLALDVYLEYGAAPGEYDHVTSIATVAGGTPIEAVMDGLAAGTRYYYRMRYRQPDQATFLVGREGSFVTQRAPGSSYVFTVQADSHVQPALRTHRLENLALYRRTLRNAYADNPDFHIDLGDTSHCEYHEGRDALDYTEAFSRHLAQRPFLGLLCHSVPFFYVLGNHEAEQGWRLTGTPENLAVWATNARKLLYPNPVEDGFYTGNSTMEEFVGLREDYYAWEWGDALFVVLDPYWHTEAWPYYSLDRWDWTLGREQYDWLKCVLESSDATFKFVFSHHLTGGLTGYAQGGIEAVRHAMGGRGSFEWGGEHVDGAYDFDVRRRGWGLPIHELMVAHDVAVYFHGHDHVFAKQDLDGIAYVECPQPSDASYGFGPCPYFYAHGDLLPNSGHVRVTVSGEVVTVDYVRAYLPGDGPNGEVAYSFTIADCNANGVPDPRDIASGTSRDWNRNGVPDECECVGDLDGDRAVDVVDLQIVLRGYHVDAAGDLDGDGDTDLSDLAIVLARYGAACE